jgi:hypothetical protein
VISHTELQLILIGSFRSSQQVSGFLSTGDTKGAANRCEWEPADRRVPLQWFAVYSALMQQPVVLAPASISIKIESSRRVLIPCDLGPSSLGRIPQIGGNP